MTIKTKFIIYFSLIFVVVGIISGFMIWGTGKIESYLAKDLPVAVESVRINSKLDITAQLIRYNDEVLTQSARNYAFTGEKKWKARYEEYVPKLDLRIKQAIEKGDAEDKKIFESINQANLALVDLETQALALADQGELQQAQAILDGEEYAKQKAIYKDGVEKYLTRRGAQSDQAMSVSTDLLSSNNNQIKNMVVFEGWFLGIFMAIMIILLIILYVMIYYSVIIPLGQFKEAAQEIASGNLDQKVPAKSRDEVGDLAQTFNQMAVEIKESRQNIEAKVKERTEELEKLNRFMTGRELKMVELKKKIEELEQK